LCRRKVSSEQQTNYPRCSEAHGGIGKQNVPFLQEELIYAAVANGFNAAIRWTIL
jgi:hypothetical protein